MKKILKVFIVIIIVLVGLLGFRFYTLGPESQEMNVESTLNRESMSLGTCPDKPNCISSFANNTDETHYFPAVEISKEKLVNIPKFFQDNCVNKKRDENYWYYVCSSKIFNFADDSELLYKEDEEKLYFRFASRVGHSDLGANKKRAQALIEFLSK